MAYVLMLLADPGPERERVLSVLRKAPDVRPDERLENRFWLLTPHGRAQVNVGTKDPVESIHVELDVELDPGPVPLLEAVTERALSLAGGLGMCVEDVQWGREISGESLPGLREYWRTLSAGTLWVPGAAASERARPWWKLW